MIYHEWLVAALRSPDVCFSPLHSILPWPQGCQCAKGPDDGPQSQPPSPSVNADRPFPAPFEIMTPSLSIRNAFGFVSATLLLASVVFDQGFIGISKAARGHPALVNAVFGVLFFYLEFKARRNSERS